MRQHKGFTILQMLIAMLIFAILSSMGVGMYNKQISRAHIDQVSTTLQMMAGTMEAAVQDMGFLDYDAEGTTSEETVLRYLEELENVYFTHTWNVATLQMKTFDEKSHGFTVEMNEKDVWGTPLTCHYIITPDARERVIFASAGPDGTWAADGNMAYASKQYEDDILILMIRRD